jgi:imidazolonepropionase-like amidohydrolase
LIISVLVVLVLSVLTIVLVPIPLIIAVFLIILFVPVVLIIPVLLIIFEIPVAISVHKISPFSILLLLLFVLSGDTILTNNVKQETLMLIKNGKIVTMAGKIFDPGCVLIAHSKIKKVAAFIDDEENSDELVIDANGCWVLPGLIDAHCHIGIQEEGIGNEGNDTNEITKPLTPQIRAIDAINPMDSAFHNAIKAGITSVMAGPGSANVVGGQFVFMKTQGRCVDRMIVMAPAAMKVAFGENTKSNYGDNNMMPSTRMSIAAMLREELFEAKRYCASKENADESFKEEFTLECWVPVFSGKIPLKAHVHRADDILTAIRIAKEYGLDMTLDHCSEGHLVVDEIKESGFPAIVGPSMASRNKAEIKYMDFKTAGILHKAGIRVAIMTDHPVSLIQCLPLCAGIAAREGLGTDAALEAITINAARICNVDERVGSLEAGKDADIAIFDGHPLEIFTKCRYTIIDGHLIYQAEAEQDGQI